MKDVVEVNELISRIEEDYKIRKKIEDPLSTNIFSADKSTTGISGEFILFLNFSLIVV